MTKMRRHAYCQTAIGLSWIKVVPLGPPEPAARRLGFLAGQIAVPEDFDRMGDAAIERLFGGG